MQTYKEKNIEGLDLLEVGLKRYKVVFRKDEDKEVIPIPDFRSNRNKRIFEYIISISFQLKAKDV